MSDYIKKAEDFAKKWNVLFVVHEVKHDLHFEDDTKPRYRFRCTLSRKIKIVGPKDKYYHTNRKYTFWFGQSYKTGAVAPDLYDVLSVMGKYEPGTFEEWIREFGYASQSLSDYPKVMKIYKACQKEYNALCRLFPEEEAMNELREIQ